MSCSGTSEDQIFLVEITVERLMLNAEKYKEEFQCASPLVKIKYLEFPVFVIGRRPRDTCAGMPNSEPYDESVGLVYASGKSCLFVMKPSALVRSMQIRPLAIGIFRNDETFPIAEGSISMSGCLCDQVAMARNDAFHRPEPFELYGSYCLLDPGKTPAGTVPSVSPLYSSSRWFTFPSHSGFVKIFFRLTLIGDYIVSHYQLYQNSCVFRNDFDGEMRVTKVCDEDDDDDDDYEGEEGDEAGKKQGCNFQMSGHTVLAAMKSGIKKKESLGEVKSVIG